MQYNVALSPIAAAYLTYRIAKIVLSRVAPTDVLLATAWHIIITPKVFIYAGARAMLGENLTAVVPVEANYRHNTRKKELMNTYERLFWSNSIELEFTRLMYREIIESNSPTKIVLDWQERLGLDEDEFNSASYIRTFHNRRIAEHPLTL